MAAPENIQISSADAERFVWKPDQVEVIPAASRKAEQDIANEFWGLTADHAAEVEGRARRNNG